MLDDLADATDIANVERLRPTTASDELNMHNEQISGRIQHGPAPGTLPTVFSDEDKAALSEIDPDIANSLATLNNDQREAVKAFLQEVTTPAYHEDFQKIRDKENPGAAWTEERRKAHGEKVRAAHARKKK